MSVNDNVRIIQELFGAVNRHDSDRAASLVDPSVEWVDMATGQTFHGLDEFKGALNSWLSAFPDCKMELTKLVVGYDGAGAEYIGRGTNRGPVMMPSGQIPPTGRQMEMKFCDVYQFGNGKIISIHMYYDLATLKRQLGQAPMTKQAGA